MLTYSYTFKNKANKESIELNDFYISPNLSFISGTTDSSHSLNVGEPLWLSSPNYPRPQKLNVISEDTIKRNGYVLYDLILPLNCVYYSLNNNDELLYYPAYYVEYKGNIYYANREGQNKSITIEGLSYTVDASQKTLTIKAKSYVEDNKVIIDDYTFDVIVDKNGYVTITDADGNPYVSSIVYTDNVTLDYEYVQKVVIGNDTGKNYDINGIYQFGWRPYIVYQGGKEYLDYTYDSYGVAEGFGLVIDSKNYNAILINEYSHPYEQDSYPPSMFINNEEYKIQFDADSVHEGRLLCVEMSEEQLPIVIGQRLTVNIPNTTSRLTVYTDTTNNKRYTYYNSHRYDVIKNLCDKVLINSTEYPLTYEGDSENPSIGMLVTCSVGDGTMHFKVQEINSLGSVSKLQKIIYKTDRWVDAYTLSYNDNGKVEYRLASDYIVNNYDGIEIDNESFMVETDSYDSTKQIIYVTLPLEYNLKVEDTIGSNMVICSLDIEEDNFLSYQLDEITSNEISSLIGNNIQYITCKSLVLSNKDINPKDWTTEWYNAGESTSIYQLCGILDNLYIEKKKNYFSIPINLCRPTDDSLNTSNGIMYNYYDDVEEESINSIVDMDKDMYTPIVVSNNVTSNVEKIIFNLHFRTRDLETWEINQDEGTYTQDSGGTKVNLSINNDYTNWFVTDYYPYNQFLNSNSSVYNSTDYLNNCMSRSDLLGFLYFTTNDIEEKRKKLTKSFLRLSYYDSKYPDSQNLLGTSTIFLDVDKCYDTMYGYHGDVVYNEVAASQQCNRIPGSVTNEDAFNASFDVRPTVLMECFNPTFSEGILQKGSCKNLCIGSDSLKRYDSQLVITDRYTTDTSSEGFYPYILKAFANKNKSQTIYMKVEFFHAGVGIKIPMVIATDSNKHAIASWNKNKLSTFKEGYPLNEIYDRLYIPITIYYDKSLREFVYTISDDNNFFDAIRDGNTFVFNLFELKIKSN